MVSLQAQVDDKSKAFLRAVEYYGGEATTSDIRGRTGLTQTEVNYRFDKLASLDLIDITRADVGHGNRDPPKVAHLTGEARSLIERGLLGEFEADEDSADVVEVSEEEVRAMKDDIKELRQRLNVVTQIRRSSSDEESAEGEAVSDEVRERVEGLEQRFARLESETSGEGVTPKQVAEAPAVKTIEKRVGELEAAFAELGEYVYEWNSSASTFMTALRKMVESELGVSMDSYLENAK